jgi:PleD family two-component response regulator
MQTELLDNPTPCAVLEPLHARVLVVDDEEPNRTLLRDSLEPHGYEIEEAAEAKRPAQRRRRPRSSSAGCHDCRGWSA